MKFSSDVLQVLNSARSRALAAGHPKVTASHLLAALLDEPSVKEAVERAGGSPARLADLVAAQLLHVSGPSLVERVVSRLAGHPEVVESRSFRRVLGAASRHIRRASLAEVGVVDVLVASFADSDAATLMRDAGLSHLPLLRYHCHGLPATGQPNSELPQAVQCDVVILNDDYTEMATVVEILRRVFGMDGWSAYKTMRLVHRQGSAIAGRYPREDALQLVGIATGMAEAAGAPLRVVMRRPEGPAEQSDAPDEARR